MRIEIIALTSIHNYEEALAEFDFKEEVVGKERDITTVEVSTLEDLQRLMNVVGHNLILNHDEKEGKINYLAIYDHYYE